MATSAGVGLSQHRSSRIAGREAAEQALAAADVTRPDLVIVHATVGYELPELLASIRSVTGGAPLTGCSVSGCIGRGVADESAHCVEVAVLKSDELRFHHARVPDIAKDPGAAGRGLGEALRPHFGDDAVGLLFFGDAFTLNYTAVKRGLDEALGIERFLPVLGGGANNDIQSMRTFQFHDDELLETGACCTLVSGQASIVTAVTHGCTPLGIKQTVTRSRGNMIYELDGVPALDVVRQYLTEDERQNWWHTVNNLCLGLEVPETIAGEYDPLCIRYIVGRDVDAGAIMIQTEITEGTPIWLARRDAQRIAAETTAAAGRLRAKIGDRTPKFMLHFECTGRGKLFLREPEKLDLIARIQAVAEPAVPWLGAYVGGEIGPVGTTNMFHNYTAVVAAVL